MPNNDFLRKVYSKKFDRVKPHGQRMHSATQMLELVFALNGVELRRYQAVENMIEESFPQR